MVVRDLAKVEARVRFPHPAPVSCLTHRLSRDIRSFELQGSSHVSEAELAFFSLPEGRIHGIDRSLEARRCRNPRLPHESLLVGRHPETYCCNGAREFAVLWPLSRCSADRACSRGNRSRYVRLSLRRVRSRRISRQKTRRLADGMRDEPSGSSRASPLQPRHARRSRSLSQVWFCGIEEAAIADGNRKAGTLFKSELLKRAHAGLRGPSPSC